MKSPIIWFGDKAKNLLSGGIVDPSNALISVNTELQSYTPATQGFGTISSLSAFYVLLGGKLMLLSVTFTPGECTGVEAQVALPSGYKVGALGSIKGVGMHRPAASLSNCELVLATPEDTFLNFGNRVNFGTFAPANADNIAEAGTVFGFFAAVPVAEA